jgi:hypothetical protein
MKGRRQPENNDTASASGRLLICLPSAQPSPGPFTFLKLPRRQIFETSIHFKFGYLIYKECEALFLMSLRCIVVIDLKECDPIDIEECDKS